MCKIIRCLLQSLFWCFCGLKSWSEPWRRRGEGNRFISKGLSWCLAESGWRSRWRCVSPPSTWRWDKREHKNLGGDMKQIHRFSRHFITVKQIVVNTWYVCSYIIEPRKATCVYLNNDTVYSYLLLFCVWVLHKTYICVIDDNKAVWSRNVVVRCSLT